MEEQKKLTPMMEQWKECKKEAKGAILFFRLGDFYEAFYEDAAVLSKELDLTLTKRQDIPMSGIPWHAGEGYIDRLISKGYRVAIAEQVEDPKVAKGLVKRKITRFITPGTLLTSSLLSEKTNNYLASITQVGACYGLAFLEISTGDFFALEAENEKDALNEIFRFKPAELLLARKMHSKHHKLFKEIDLLYHPLLTFLDEWTFDHELAYQSLTKHFQVLHVDGYGLKGKTAAINAAGALLTYTKEELSLPISYVQSMRTYSIGECLSLDKSSIRHLELTSLLNVIDHTLTPMGGRLMHQWLLAPLLSVKEIHLRQETLAFFLEQPHFHEEIRGLLAHIRDLQRPLMRIPHGSASPRDLVSLKESLKYSLSVKKALAKAQGALLQKCEEGLIDLSVLVDHLEQALLPEPPLRLSDGNLFKEGFHPALDQLKSASRDSKTWIANYQERVREETGIKTLKVGFNRVFGYYIEVSKGASKTVPESFHRRQTLANAERFISPELKEYEDIALSAEERLQALEAELFQKVLSTVASEMESIRKIADSIALIDTLQALAQASKLHGYVRPLVDSSYKLEIAGGWHPVIAPLLPKGTFIPNDTSLENENKQLMLITGPNMGGKSTYIKQVALTVILAQIGSFVPAKKAHLGIVDKIFTRIGASDDLSRGQSTFMVEMSETANILHHATNRSLVILDEIGRGTSTYDGVSIAWSVAEYLLLTKNKQAKTLFATHYWELTHLETLFPQAVNYHASVKEVEGDIVFLHKIVQGAADRSYGIHVAKLAGLPLPVISRAEQILHRLEKRGKKEKKEENKVLEKQLTFL